MTQPAPTTTSTKNNNDNTILLGGGCFWCTEAVFLAVKGVTKVVSGYAGGQAETANYDAVCTGNTGHVEVIAVTYDESVIDTKTLLGIFFTIHDPTTPNRQGNDIGTQYASVIFYLAEQQRLTASDIIKQLKADGIPVVTHVAPAPVFYLAEDYHQNFYNRNPNQGYCNAVIPPKLAKLQQQYAPYFIA